MAESPTEFMNPDLLVWAREKAGFHASVAARKLHVEEAELLRWEAGEARPTIVQLRKAAEVYRRPLALFFLPEPPRGINTLHDYRLHAGQEAGLLSPELSAALQTARERREILLSLMDEEPDPFPIRAAPEEDPEDVASRIRERLGVTLDQQVATDDKGKTLALWRGAVESLGVLVFQAGGISEEQMRGVSISENPLPVILINGKDSARGKLFSLLHEMAHLALHEGGICTLVENQRVETFCNRVAAATLLPRAALERESLISTRRVAVEWTDEELHRLSRKFSVSSEMMLLRLVHMGKATQEFYERKRPEFLQAYARQKAKDKEKKGGPTYYQMYFRDNGFPFVRTVLGAYYEERATLRDVTNYLGVRVKNLPRIEREAWAAEGY